MKLLILAESLRINETSSGIVSSTFIQALSNAGHDITCFYPKTFEYPVSWLEGVRLLEFNYLPQKKRFIDRIPKIRALPTYIQGYSLDFKDKILQWRQLISAHLNEVQYDAIVVLGSGSEFIPHFAMQAIRTSIPCVYNFHDPFPWHVYPEPYKKPVSIPSLILQQRVQRIIDRASLVSFPSEYLKQHMCRIFKNLVQKSLVLPHVGIRLENLPVSAEDSLLGLDKGKFNVLHAGSLLGPRNPRALIHAFIRFLQDDEAHQATSTLTIVGKIARENKDIMRLAEANIRIIDDRVSYHRSLELMQEASVLLIIEAKADFSPFLPGKFSDYIVAQKSILALTPRRSEVIRLLGDDYPYWAILDDEDGIYSHIKALWMLWRSSQIKNPVPKYLIQYVADVNVNQLFTSAIHSCTSSSSSPMA